ncbi:GIY-YIG nuclease family protein [bacterium]|nr:GIY-YIG nuclease family protein [bacterium]
MSTGWVYVLSNPSIPNKVKVGWTKNRPESRAKELQSTGVPTPFKVETAMLFANKAEQIEHKTHDILSRNRVSSNREWFDCDASIAAGSILKAAEFFHEEVLTTDPVLLTKDDILKAKRREEQKRVIQAQRKEAQKLKEERLEELKRGRKEEQKRVIQAQRKEAQKLREERLEWLEKRNVARKKAQEESRRQRRIAEEEAQTYEAEKANTNGSLIMRLFSFRGRIGRDQFILGYLIKWIFLIILTIIHLETGFIPAVLFLSLILIGWLYFSLLCRRLKDCGETPYILILLLIPFLNILVGLVVTLLCIFHPTSGKCPQKYGEKYDIF